MASEVGASEATATATARKKKQAVGRDAGRRRRPLTILHRIAAQKRGWLTSNRFFKQRCRQAFELVDFDKSGTVSHTETYVAVLLFYSKASVLAKGLQPPAFADVARLVASADSDSSGSVDADEFESLCVVLMEHLTARILLQVAFAMLVVPVVAARLVALSFHLFVEGTKCQVLFSPAIGQQLASTAIIAALVPPLLDKYERTCRPQVARATGDDNGEAGLLRSARHLAPEVPEASSTEDEDGTSHDDGGGEDATAALLPLTRPPKKGQ